MRQRVAVLDPAFFAVPVGQALDERRLRDDLDRVIQLVRESSLTLCSAPDYWHPVMSELVAPLEKTCGPDVKQALQVLRRLARVVEGLPPAGRTGRVWGFKPQFEVERLGLSSAWPDRMARAVTRIVSAGHEVVVLTRRIVGRDLERHRSNHIIIDEPLRWRLYVQPGTARPVPIPCVGHARHLKIPWTARFDPRLPASEDEARYPFCPPATWWRRSTVAVTTRQSKPAFIDSHGHGWTRPNTPGTAHHWDVFITSPATIAAVGVDQINVVQHGAPPSEGRPGALHHVPSSKAGRVSDVGWRCSS
ncbi:MAG TPA: hypothetical protein PK095_14375 [Myxococcota bacterium]|nr:hypothetical protein [Myxococcota bacterium]